MDIVLWFYINIALTFDIRRITKIKRSKITNKKWVKDRFKTKSKSEDERSTFCQFDPSRALFVCTKSVVIHIHTLYENEVYENKKQKNKKREVYGLFCNILEYMLCIFYLSAQNCDPYEPWGRIGIIHFRFGTSRC